MKAKELGQWIVCINHWTQCCSHKNVDGFLSAGDGLRIGQFAPSCLDRIPYGCFMKPEWCVSDVSG